MNLADYLSELLGLHDEVNVPGLGYFIRNRVNAYYNDTEGRFYPPYHQVKFVPLPKDDEIFAQYVADKKNISLASSKYFVEKFITKLKEDASKGKYLFADLGSFQGDQDQLVFKPNERIPADPEFYGFPSIDIFKATQPLSADTKRPVLAPDQPAAAPAPTVATTPPPPRAIHSPEYYEDEVEVEQKRRVNVWLILLIIVALLGLAAFGVYKFYPQAFDKIKVEYNKLTGKPADTAAVVRHESKEIKKDSAKKTMPATDTAKKAAITVVKPDSLKLPTFEAIAEETRRRSLADARVTQLKSLGFDAHIVQNAPGPLIKISVGSYPTWGAADSVEKKLLKSGVIKMYHVPLDIVPK
jgi:hypothetical protein